MRSTSATSFQVNPLRRARPTWFDSHESLQSGFSITPVGELRTEILSPSLECGGDQTVQTKMGCPDESNSRHTQRTRFLVGGRGSGMAGISTTLVLSGARSNAAAGPLWFLAFEVKPAWQGLSCWKNDTFCKKTSLLCGAESQRPSRVSAHFTQEAADAKRQVFGAQQVWPSTKVRCRGIDFQHLMSLAARFPARKKFLKSSRTMLVP